jgi:Zn-dependent protease
VVWSITLLLFADNLTPAIMFGILTAVLIGMTVHEFAHNLVAHLMGDPTPSRQGRLTLNPLVHIYWPGFIMFVLIGFGILGTAPVNHRMMRNPRWGYLAAVAAGPFSNLLVAIVGGILWRIAGDPLLGSAAFVEDFLVMIVLFNVLLFIFNLLPLFPLDGWSIVLTLLPAEQAYVWQRNAQNTQLVFLVLLMLSFLNIPGIDPFGLLIGEPVSAITDLLIG